MELNRREWLISRARKGTPSRQLLIGRGFVILINSSITRSLADVRQAPIYSTLPRELGKMRNDTNGAEYERIVHKWDPQRYPIQAIANWKKTRSAYKLIHLPLLGWCGTGKDPFFSMQYQLGNRVRGETRNLVLSRSKYKI
jgi:hypothetical protein